MTVDIRIEEEPIDRLDEHALISIAFTVERILALSRAGAGLGGILLTETAVEVPWVKDYDVIKGEGPTRWPKRFDTSSWGLIAAYDDRERVGGAVVAFKTAGVRMLESPPDATVLWDLRVSPDHRASGVGSALFGAAGDWCRQRRCRFLKVETQNVNVPACRFYARMGCTLEAIDGRAYPDLPEEAQLIWLKDLTPQSERVD
ncbi:MAG: GNAT family N-acetyltransferase [Acidimicrobiales bacterium]